MYIYLLAYVVHQYTYKNIMKWYQLQLPSSLKYLGSIWMYQVGFKKRTGIHSFIKPFKMN